MSNSFNKPILHKLPKLPSDQSLDLFGSEFSTDLLERQEVLNATLLLDRYIKLEEQSLAIIVCISALASDRCSFASLMKRV